MGSEWTTALLGELTVNYDGRRKPVKESERRPGPFPYYGASGVVDYVDDYLFDGDYLLVAEDGENLRTRQTPIAFMARGKFWVNNHAHIVTGNDKADTRFLMYALARTDISGYLTGAVMPKLTQGNLNKIELNCPPLIEQRAIAHILGTLDDKIELNRRINQTLEAMAQAIFKSWFVDFDPVKSKIAAIEQGQDPERAAMRVISGKTDAELDQLPRDQYDQLATTAALFPEAMEDSELGEIPAGWVAGAIGDLAELTIGGDWGKDDPIDEQYVQAVCLRGVDLEHLRATGECPKAPVRWVKKSSIEKRSIESVDLLIGGSGAGPCGRPLYASPLLLDLVGYPVIYSNFVKRFRCKTSSQALYLDRVLWGMFTGGEISNYINGTSVPNLKDKGLFLHSIVIPNFDVLMEFENISQGWLGKLYSKESAGLVELRDTLLPKLISGELRVTQQVLP
ncbi:protein HsdA [Lysobacteraceae bacterium NML120232]|nr:protein HsdA [Xanthomonadaceae bacterium NML120232]